MATNSWRLAANTTAGSGSLVKLLLVQSYRSEYFEIARFPEEKEGSTKRKLNHQASSRSPEATAHQRQRKQHIISAQQDEAQQDGDNLMRHRSLIRAILPGSGVHTYVVASRRQASAASCDGDARDGAGSRTCAQQADSLCTKLASQLECELDPRLLACLLVPLACFDSCYE